jgi:Sulfotransferase family
MDKKTRNRPDFIIIGAMKCATSALHDQLKEHDSFFMTTPKEPNFFSDDNIFKNGFVWYESLFSQATFGQLRGESSTHYTKLPKYPETLKRLVEYCPGIKCIYMMRHPVDRLVSHYIHEWTQRVISCEVNQAVYRFPELIDYGRYAMQLEPYLATYGSINILPVFAERFRDNPVRELQRVFDFLNVEENPKWHAGLRSNVSSDRIRACTWRDTIVNNTILRFMRKTFVPKKIRTQVRNLWKLKEMPELSSKSLKYVSDIFDQDLMKIGEMLGMSLSCKNYKEIVINENCIEWY